MAQVSYGTITITDTNDIEKIYMEYAQSQNNQTAPTTGWDDDIPTWREGYYIWQRTVTKMSGVPLSQDSYGEPVCLTGSTGSSGAPGQSVDSIVTSYCNYGTGTPAATYSGWQSAVPAYDSTKPNYWIKTVITYSNPTTTDTKIYKDNGITSATSTAAAANTTAQNAKDKADDAWDKADNAETIAGNANTAISDLNQYFWRKKSASTNVPAGSYVTNIPGTTYQQDPANGGFNSLVQANGIFLRNGIATLSSWTGDALTFYHPTNSGQGNRGMELSSSTLKFYDSTGTVAQATFGGTQATVSGTINVYDGKIGNASNYWYIGNYTDYNQNDSAIIKSIGTASIQLNETNTWRIATNRIHTAWAPATGTDAYKLHFPIYVDSENTNRHWDYGLHLPTSYSDKFLYIRNAASSETLDNLLDDLDDAGYNYWNYIFYIDGSGNLHAGDIYSHGTLISGTSAPYLLKSGGTMTGNITMSNGAKLIGDVTGNVSGSAGKLSNTSKIGDTNKPVYFSASGVPVAISYEINKSVPSNAIFTDQNVRSTQANTTKLWLVGTPTSGDRTGELNYDSNIYADTTAGALHATTFNGYTLAAASAKGIDTSLTTSTTSTNLPTSAAVVNLIKQYLPLTGGNVTGAVIFGDSVSADELTARDLVVNGSASFTNNLQANTINGIAVGSNPKFTDTVTTVTVTGSGNAITSMTASNGAITATKGSTFLTSYTETDPIFVASAAHGITSNDISNWNSKTSNTGTVTSVRVQASSPLQSSVSTAQNASLNTTISFTNQDANTVLAGPASGSAAAAPTFRKLVVADIPDISGTYYLASNPSGYTTNTGTVTSVRVQASSPLTSTTNTASSTTLDTTIKFSNQNKNLVLAGPSSGNTAAVPTFRSLVADDIPSISKSKISDFPTSLKNPNAIRLNLFNETAARAAANQGTATSYVDYDGSTVNQSFSAAGKNAITSIGISGDTLSWIRADGSSGSSTVTITASVASGATVLTDTNGNAISTTGSTTPVYFDGGVPKDVTGIAFSLLPTGTGASNVAVGNHSHGNITNGGDITTTATIASGDRLVINDESESKINNSSITFGTSTTTFLSNKGTWETPIGTTYTFDGTYNASTNKAATVSTVTNAIAALDGGTIGTPSTSKTVTAISQTNGNISVTFGDISITKSQISDFPTSMTPAAHTHDDRYYTETEIDDRFKKYIPFSHYSNTNGNNSGKYYKISINSYTGWMLNFTVKMYHAYRAFDLQISGYNYGSSHWYSPAAVILGASVTNTVEVNFGYDSDYHLWIAIPAEQYTGIGVTGFTNGYQQVDSWEDLFTITMVDGLPSTKQSTVTAYRPWYRNETVSNATSATSAGKWTTARNFTIKDSDSTNSGTAASVDGSGAVTLLLPSTIKASLTGNASTATKWASAQTVYVALGTASTTTTIQGGNSSAQTIGVNGTLAIGNGGTGLTASPSMLTNLGSTTAANVLQASPRPGITGTLGVANGGTGQTSAKNAANAFLNALDTGSSTPVDADYYISQYVSGGTTTTTYHRRPMSALWSYISGKISSSGTYVTIATDQTITASQKTFNGATRWSVANSATGSKYGACNYDATLDALVFSFGTI